MVSTVFVALRHAGFMDLNDSFQIPISSFRTEQSGAERSGRADVRTGGRTDGRTDGRADGRTDERAGGRTGGRMYDMDDHVRMGGRSDGRTDGQSEDARSDG